MNENSEHKVIFPEPMSYKKLIRTEWPEEVFIEGGIMSRGDCLLIAADSKAGKSTFIAGLVRQIITGGNFIGFKVVKPLKVLNMQAELREYRLKERMFPTYSPMQDEILENSYVWNTRGLITIVENAELIASNLRQIKPDILIIDPMINFHNYQENDATQMMAFFRVLDRLQHDFNLSVIMAQHFKKTQDNNPKHKLPLLEMVRGSSALRGWADTTIAMEGRTVDEYRRLEFDIRNSHEIIKRLIRYNPNTREFDWADPLALVINKLKDTMPSSVKLTSEEFINHIIEHCGNSIGRQRSRIFDLKKTLIQMNFINEEVIGKVHYISLI